MGCTQNSRPVKRGKGQSRKRHEQVEEEGEGGKKRGKRYGVGRVWEKNNG